VKPGNNRSVAVIFPLTHENMRGRRWPWITIGLIALNTVIFLYTNFATPDDYSHLAEAEYRVLVFNSWYPDAQMTPIASDIVGAFRLGHSEAYNRLTKQSASDDDGEADPDSNSHRLSPADANTEMSKLCAQLEQVQAHSIAWNCAFHAIHPKPWSLLTASFLHGGWLHLIFNMWFLWLAGTALEDLWGRIVYPIFYLATGVLANAVHGMVFPHSLVPCIGASGAIAGLMGAFLARFPKTKIRLGWVFFFKVFKFNVPAYIILPMWLAIQLFWGILVRSLGVEGGVGYWAHIGGFAFGALGAVMLRATGIEQSADQAIEAKVTWSADDRIVRATESLGEDNPAEAIVALRELVREKPESLDAWDLLLKAQIRKQDFEGQKETHAVLCRLRLADGDPEGAWNDYMEYKNLGGTRLPRGVWLEICRYLETKDRWESAAEEYEKLARANPKERAGVTAMVAAGRIYATHLYRFDRAERLLKEAAASPAPHSDLDAAIQEGLKQCAACAATPGSYSR
jgi:membrane associated rhomboid family serine protease